MIKRRTEGEFKPVTRLSRREDGVWSECGSARLRIDGQWRELRASERGIKSAVLTPIACAVYWGSGGREASYPDELFQGSYSGERRTARRSIIIFSTDELAAVIGQGELLSAELFLDRTDTAHGEGSAYLRIGMHSYSVLPARWDSGTDMGAATLTAPVLTRSGSKGEGRYIPLSPAAAAALAAGTINGFTLNSGTNYALSRYCRVKKSAVRLRITYR